MSQFQIIKNKLEAFIKRYYTNELIKGTILFFAIGLLYFLFTLFLEYMLWMGTTARAILFWLFVLVELVLLGKFILLPLAKLFKLQKGINYEDASRIIGHHFPEVNDKLLNVLQLQREHSQSELLLASIEQKSIELNPIPFKLAIDFKKSLAYLKYAAIPIIIMLLSYFFGGFSWFSDSYKRVVHYKTAYEPPAPFQFFVVNDNLSALENRDFKLLVKTAGDVVPENAQIRYNNETYFLQQTGVGEFEYVFSQPKETTEFQLEANGVTSKPYSLSIVETPSLLGFEMVLDYPNYTSRDKEVLKGTGNAVVPEGTKVSWNLNTKATDNVFLYASDTIRFDSEKKDVFKAAKKLFRDFDYSISTSNNNLANYENLAFKIDVVKDEYPELNIKVEKDTIDDQTLYFYGKASDDYGFNRLELVYYPSGNDSEIKREVIPVPASNVTEFISAFPNNLEISEGIPYELYFQVFDNDEVNNYKSSKSSVFNYRKRTTEEETEKKLQEQSETIDDLNKSLDKFSEQEQNLKELKQTQREKSSLNFNDQKKLESFLRRQRQQDEMMKNFNKKLKDNLEEFQNDQTEPDAFKEDLQKRLQENEQQLEQDEELLKELQELQEKFNNEQLIRKLEELSKQNANKKRSLEQLLELTKRFYIEKKLDKLKEDLLKTAIEQEKLSNESNEENTKEKQEPLNDAFEDFTKQMEDLQKENKTLKKPMDIPRDKLDENEIKNAQQKASQELDKQEQQQASDKEDNTPLNNENLKEAQKNQKKAAQKMRNMAQKMIKAMEAGAGEQLQEDVAMLRQVLDNLVIYSLDQESLMDKIGAVDVGHNKYADYLRNQNSLRENFEHIDDSLFALSLRQPKLSETVNKEISEVYFNIDRALSQFAEGRTFQGVSNQQFAITAANNLADFLSNILDNMQEQMSMSQSQGQGMDMQLPDIIMGQEELNKMMEENMQMMEGEGKESEEGQENEGENGQQQEGNGMSEEQNGQLFEIYQQQQQLRQALEQQLQDKISDDQNGLENNLLNDMEEVEMDLLNNGFTNQTLQKMLELQHQLLKLENATFQQGEDNKRESETNRKQFNNTSNNQIPTAKEYFKTTEILNKQALPLQPVYKRKVQEYFKTDND
ncbi:hypothetical protein KO566_01025 [Flavobacteriaceae bacterium XHP0103]|uniref:DUF4175 family protein n=1 Tax=Marixanthotalea marina TaxID=2844359 RepID=UPI002989BE3A|nr:DUF4175 family protein [Marixanthotalea marina]MBU3820626.1 hypothetical protein [Marixanthotalea marina]